MVPTQRRPCPAAAKRQPSASASTPSSLHRFSVPILLGAQGFLYGRPTPVAAVPVDRVRTAVQPEGASLTPARSDSCVAASQRAHVGDMVPVGIPPSLTSDAVASALRGLLRIRSAQAAADLLQATAQQLGATLVLAADAGPDALPIDLSLGEGPPLLAVVESLSPARLELEHILPRLAEDARRAVDLLRQNEHPEDESNHDNGESNLDRTVP